MIREIGILVIDLRSRARLRVNGRVEFPAENQLHIDVEQAYPNCPQYIQRRIYRPSTDSDTNPRPVRSDGIELNRDQQQWIADADTLFVASGHPKAGIDASHRGGNSGVIQVVNSTRLRIPRLCGKRHVQHARQLCGQSACRTRDPRFREWPHTPTHLPLRSSCGMSTTQRTRRGELSAIGNSKSTAAYRSTTHCPARPNFLTIHRIIL